MVHCNDIGLMGYICDEYLNRFKELKRIQDVREAEHEELQREKAEEDAKKSRLRKWWERNKELISIFGIATLICSIIIIPLLAIYEAVGC